MGFGSKREATFVDTDVKQELDSDRQLHRAGRRREQVMKAPAGHVKGPVAPGPKHLGLT